MNFGINARLAGAPGDELGVLGTEIEDDDFLHDSSAGPAGCLLKSAVCPKKRAGRPTPKQKKMPLIRGAKTRRAVCQ